MLASYPGLSFQNRNMFRGPGYFNLDMSLFRNFRIREKATFGVGMTAYNLLNHPNFANPDGGICTAVSPADPTTNTPASCTPNPNFGRTGQTIADNMGSQIGNGTSRQVQFSAKIIF